MRTALGVVLVVGVFAGGCKDQGKESAKFAALDATVLAEQIDKDVAEIDRGLPIGASKLASVFANGADPHLDAAGVRQALMKTQREVPDLTTAKSTFFALADDKGIGIRNNLEQDAMAGQDLVKVFPEITKALAGSYVTTSGSFSRAPGPAGPDKAWIAATPVKNDSGKILGIYVTGWSLRAFGRHLTEVWKRKAQEDIRLNTGNGLSGKLPVVYIGVFDKSGVYMAPLTPDINEKALVDANLVEKTASGSFTGTVTLTERDFGYAAVRTPKLGADTGVVVLRSEL